ncbi:MAG TPA: hypothetical protein PKE32_02960 [Miltoncostaeaceae bacterium]|nr:hypothetical protein [Miltoncostaeaceae bacterium]
MTALASYRIAFSAVADPPADSAAAHRLREALRTMPGIDAVDDVAQDGDARRVYAAFWISVRLGMADAARDGSRLAKEALKVAGLAETLLVELAVTLQDDASGA